MRLRPVLLLAVLALGSCNGGEPPPSVEPVTCQFPYPAPSGWTADPPSRVPQGTHVGVGQLFHRDAQTLAYSAGVLRDQFETAPLREGLELSDGGRAALFALELPPGGYTLFWYGPEPCKQFAIDGPEGFARPGDFLATLREVGVLAPGVVSRPSP